MPVGFSMMTVTTAAAAEPMVATKKTWITWNAKYEFCTVNSTADNVGSPPSLAKAVKQVSRFAQHLKIWDNSTSKHYW